MVGMVIRWHSMTKASYSCLQWTDGFTFMLALPLAGFSSEVPSTNQHINTWILQNKSFSCSVRKCFTLNNSVWTNTQTKNEEKELEKINKYKNSKRYDQGPIQCEFSELLRQPTSKSEYYMWIVNCILIVIRIWNERCSFWFSS